MFEAVDAVRERLVRVTALLNQASIDYAVVGGNAVGAWVSRVDRRAVRFTQDVDLMIRREDFGAVSTALEQAGFVFRHSFGVDMFVDSPDASSRDAVHLVYADEPVMAGDVERSPDVSECLFSDNMRVLELEPLVRMKLTAFRDRDRTHLRDLIGVGLIDATWPTRFPPELAARLQQIFDTPGG
jgi:hypothetical protein